jgi:hypothetical protein
LPKPLSRASEIETGFRIDFILVFMHCSASRFAFET